MKVLKNFNERNQYLIEDTSFDCPNSVIEKYVFQSYDTVMLHISIEYIKDRKTNDFAKIVIHITFNKDMDNYSNTTTKYLKQSMQYLIDNLIKSDVYTELKNYLECMLSNKNFAKSCTNEKTKTINVYC